MTAREQQFFNRKVLRWTIIIWSLVVLMIAYTHIYQNMVNEDYAHVENLFFWSLLDFSLYQMPWLSLILVVLLGVELICLKNPWKLVKPLPKES